jgi:uncharacterized membrane protein YgdD (TMEM256/DUF423 family)
MNWPAVGAILLTLAVMLGAFGAHALRGYLDAYSMGIWEKAVFYHFIHALGLLMAGMMSAAGTISAKGASRVSALLFAGILLFSGSLYALAISGQRYLGAVTPFGGIAFIAAWLWLAIELFRRHRTDSNGIS